MSLKNKLSKVNEIVKKIISKKIISLVSIFFINFLISFASFGFNGQIIHLQIKDHKFIPETLYAEPGKKIKLVVENKDNEVEEFDSPSLNRERIIPGLSTVSIILAPLEVGEYQFIGEFHQETAKGVLIIEEKDEGFAYDSAYDANDSKKNNSDVNSDANEDESSDNSK